MQKDHLGKISMLCWWNMPKVSQSSNVCYRQNIWRPTRANLTSFPSIPRITSNIFQASNIYLIFDFFYCPPSHLLHNQNAFTAFSFRWLNTYICALYSRDCTVQWCLWASGELWSNPQDMDQREYGIGEEKEERWQIAGGNYEGGRKGKKRR